MNYNNSPMYKNKGNRQFRNSDELRSPFPSPQNYSTNFSPYSYSSPQNYSRGPRRYFNNSNASTNSSSSNGSPFTQYNRRNRDNFRNNRSSSDSSNISLYYDPSCLENPWAELEKELEEKKLKESLEKEKQ